MGAFGDHALRTGLVVRRAKIVERAWALVAWEAVGPLDLVVDEAMPLGGPILRRHTTDTHRLASALRDGAALCFTERRKRAANPELNTCPCPASSVRRFVGNGPGVGEPCWQWRCNKSALTERQYDEL